MPRKRSAKKFEQIIRRALERDDDVASVDLTDATEDHVLVVSLMTGEVATLKIRVTFDDV